MEEGETCTLGSSSFPGLGGIPFFFTALTLTSLHARSCSVTQRFSRAIDAGKEDEGPLVLCSHLAPSPPPRRRIIEGTAPPPPSRCSHEAMAIHAAAIRRRRRGHNPPPLDPREGVATTIITVIIISPQMKDLPFRNPKSTKSPGRGHSTGPDQEISCSCATFENFPFSQTACWVGSVAADGRWGGGCCSERPGGFWQGGETPLSLGGRPFCLLPPS